MRVMVQLQNDAAMTLHGAGETSALEHADPATQQMLQATAELGVRLEPVHPGQTNPLLVPFFMVEVPDRETAEKVIDRLQRFNFVEAAYLKPDEQLP
jgi:hypothetical protein